MTTRVATLHCGAMQDELRRNVAPPLPPEMQQALQAGQLRASDVVRFYMSRGYDQMQATEIARAIKRAPADWCRPPRLTLDPVDHALLDDESALDAALEKQRDDMKASEGSTATVVFLGTAAYLHWAYGGGGLLLSILFFGAGMFSAALVIGIPFYLIKRGIVRLAMATTPSPSIAVVVLPLANLLLFVASLGTTIWLTRLAFFSLLR